MKKILFAVAIAMLSFSGEAQAVKFGSLADPMYVILAENPSTYTIAGLEMSGDLSVDGAVYIGLDGAISTITAAGAATLNTSLTAPDLSATDDLLVADDATISGDLIWGAAGTKSTGTAAGVLSVHGSITSGGTLTASAINVSGSGQVLTGNATSAALAALAPGQAKGALITNSTTGELCTSTGTAAGSWVLVRALATACY